MRNQRRLKKERKVKWMIGRLRNSRAKMKNWVVRGQSGMMTLQELRQRTSEK